MHFDVLVDLMYVAIINNMYHVQFLLLVSIIRMIIVCLR